MAKDVTWEGEGAKSKIGQQAVHRLQWMANPSDACTIPPSIPSTTFFSKQGGLNVGKGVGLRCWEGLRVG